MAGEFEKLAYEAFQNPSPPRLAAVEPRVGLIFRPAAAERIHSPVNNGRWSREVR